MITNGGCCTRPFGNVLEVVIRDVEDELVIGAQQPDHRG
jgi:hypothetical protein